MFLLGIKKHSNNIIIVNHYKRKRETISIRSLKQVKGKKGADIVDIVKYCPTLTLKSKVH